MANRFINDMLKYGSRLKDFRSPIMYGNGVWGGSAFATGGSGMTSGDYFHPFDKKDGSTGTGCVLMGGSYAFYNPRLLRVDSIDFHTADRPFYTSLYGSKDGTSRTHITDFSMGSYSFATLVVPEASKGFYKYFWLANNNTNPDTFANMWKIDVFGKELII